MPIEVGGNGRLFLPGLFVTRDREAPPTGVFHGDSGEKPLDVRFRGVLYLDWTTFFEKGPLGLGPARRKFMILVTLRVLDGADRGKAFEKIATPITIGREEGNSIQLNDERVSRFHAKIQEDEGKLVLTDLESTNGTKVNGENIRLWILRHGDLIEVGRSLLLVGSEEDITRRLAALRGVDFSQGIEFADDEDEPGFSVRLEEELNWTDDPKARVTLHTLLPPELPEQLSPGQRAQLNEMIHYLHFRIRNLLRSVESGERDTISVPQRRWQDLLDLENRLALYLREVGEPD